MKKIIFLFLSFSSICYSMESLDGMSSKLDKESRNMGLHWLFRDNEQFLKLKKIDEDIEKAQTPQERVALINERKSIRESYAKEQEQARKNGKYFWKEKAAVTKSQAKILETRERGQQEKEIARIKAEEEGKATIQAAREKLDFIKDNPKLIAGLASVLAIGVFSAWHGTKVAGKYLEQRLKNPTLAQETSLVGWKDKISNYFFGSEKLRSEVSDVILEPELTARISELTTSIANTVKNDSFFQNVLFYGPPGTGKTMVSKRIARSTGLEYIYFAASSLDQYSVDDALIKLTELFEFAKRCSKKLMIIIDEAEILFRDRTEIKNEKTQKMLNLILTYTGTESKNYMIVALTNRPEDLDPAFINRCDEQIEIGAPAFEQRLSILKMYVNEYLVKASKVIEQVSFWKWILGYKPKTLLKIEKDVLSEKKLREIANKLDNFVGRDISKMVIAIQQAVYASKDRTVNTDIIKRIVNLKVKQKQKELSGFINKPKALKEY